MNQAAGPEDAIVGAVIRRRRLAKGLSGLQVGQLVGCNHQQIAKYETGRNRITGLRLIRVARVFGMTGAELVAEIEAELEKAAALKEAS